MVVLLDSTGFLIITKVEDCIITKISELLHHFDEVLMGKVGNRILSVKICLNIHSN